MSIPVYSVGDIVVFKSDLYRRSDNNRTCRIASVLPEAQGVIQYRIRFDDENFERRVTEADIDRVTEPPLKREERVTSPSTASSWVNLNAIKIKK
ncbi:cold-shock protein [Neorhizobium sp. T786]|uniref:cold-shock protein n=1 Tax=Pseudorhizobium xiangyangii TaxID=2883104 RepID=UPI001CFFE61B|nr:cold-shock protein [Neorhizobium xiangyangii]MCB5204643.1 cold-shock protein [Neorhizobium xiangyangii]